MATESRREKSCPYCGRAIRGTNSSVLEINYALHVRKHELQGDHLIGGVLKRALNTLSSTSITAILAVAGLFVGNLLLNNLYKIAWPWFYVGFPPVIAGLSLFVWHYARNRLRLYAYLLLLSVSWIVSLSIGNITGGFIQAVEGLLPYYNYPIVLSYWLLYFTILALLVYAQRKVGRIMSHFHRQWFP